MHGGGTTSWLYRKMGLGAGLGPYTHPWAAPKNPRAHISMFIHSINMPRAFGPIIVLISTCLQVRSRPYCMDMHLASTKGGYINFYRTYGPHFWRSMNRLDPSDRCYAKNEVRTCGRSWGIHLLYSWECAGGCALTSANHQYLAIYSTHAPHLLCGIDLFA